MYYILISISPLFNGLVEDFRFTNRAQHYSVGSDSCIEEVQQNILAEVLAQLLIGINLAGIIVMRSVILCTPVAILDSTQSYDIQWSQSLRLPQK